MRVIKVIVDEMPGHCLFECPLKNVDRDACGHWVTEIVEMRGATWTGKCKVPDKRCLLEVGE